ncbi:hypothetical protein JX266_007067 [Neoarthrinium moseri]|nr:hypothetical protein JX266_007067 [Neoarthrinium moseri]
MSSRAEGVDSQPPQLGNEKIQPSDPWLPIILSLDGGGVRGLSSLIILHEIMRAVQTLECSDALPLPCNYFDFMIGTSTGGLIAIMLGRLRMSVEECIKEYLRLSNRIFRPKRYIRAYSAKKFRQAVEEVVAKQCGCHGNPRSCTHNHHLRQYDYAERYDTANRDIINKTCRVEKSKSEGQNRADVPYLFRSYDHDARDWKRDLNPKKLNRAELKIVDACRATTAAPFYFPALKIGGRRYIDGAIHGNNPSVYAWAEGVLMAGEPGCPPKETPNALISIGTGKKKEYPRFGFLNLLRHIKGLVVDVEKPHENMEQTVAIVGGFYKRFNVSTSDEGLGLDGLSTIRLDSCNKSKRKRFPWSEQKQRTVEDNDLTSIETKAREKRKGGYKPHKYQYKTLEKIRDRTLDYIRPPTSTNEVTADINECAQKLYDYSRRRRENDPIRWEAIRQDPNPAVPVQSVPAAS